VRRQVIAEAEAWIAHTESFSIRRTADDSPTCCQDLLHTVDPIAYPTLARLLAHSIHATPA
jgi:hypothetical protein